MKRFVVIAGTAMLLTGCVLLPGKKDQPFSGTLEAALALGVPMKCTYQMEGGQTGTSYIQGGKYYGEMDVDGKTGYVLIKDECFWSWTKEEKQGVKTCTKADEKLPNASPTSIWENEDLETPDSQINCVPTLVDGNMFNPPVDVQFTDLTEMFKNLGNEVQQMMPKLENLNLPGYGAEE